MTDEEREAWREAMGDLRSAAKTLELAMRANANMMHEIEKREQMMWDRAAVHHGFERDDGWVADVRAGVYRKRTPEEQAEQENRT